MELEIDPNSKLFKKFLQTESKKPQSIDNFKTVKHQQKSTNDQVKTLDKFYSHKNKDINVNKDQK